MWTEGAQREAEQAEHADRRSAHGQAERPRLRLVALAQARQLTERGQVGQPGGPDLAGRLGRRAALGHDDARLRRVGCGRRPEPSPGSS